MATGTNAIATRTNANSVVSGSYTSDLQRCITYASAISAGLGVINLGGRYTNNTNRLVRYTDLYPSLTLIITFMFIIDISTDASLYDYGPITLNKSGIPPITPLSYAREVEATEVEQDTNGIPLEYSNTNTSVEEPEETSMTLSTIDEVLQVAQEFEEQEQILGLTLVDFGITLTKGDSCTNLLDSATYGPVTISNKKVTFIIHQTAYSSSLNDTYTLRYPGTAMMYLKNNAGSYPKGALYQGTTSANQYQTISVTGAGTKTFTARWIKYTQSYITWSMYFRVRVSTNLSWRSIALVLANWVLLDSNGAVCLPGGTLNSSYTVNDLQEDILHGDSPLDDGYDVYAIPLGSYTESSSIGAPAFIAYDAIYVFHQPPNSDWYYDGTHDPMMVTNWDIDNEESQEAQAVGADRAIIYNELSNYKRVYISVHIDPTIMS